MAKIKLIINSVKISADSNQTILEVVHEKQIDHIPNLCMESQLEPFNSCYLCLVEIKGRDKLVPACSTKVSEGMQIETRSDRVMNGRRASLELLLSNHYADCLPPCSLRCPAGVDVQGYIALIAAGKYQEAVALIKQTNPLPAVCGRVCTRPCELSCRRNLLDKNVGIDFLKRFVADFDLETAARHVSPIVSPDQNKRVAVIGSGPAGLSAAYYLRTRGYGVTIFEAMPEAGGMLRYGIPSYRLPFDVLDLEIDTILELGIDLRTNMRLGDDITIKSLLETDGYHSVFLGLGAWDSKTLGVPGQDAEGILSGIEFLEQLGRGKQPEIKGKIVVVGGGNTAIDCARSSLRLGAEEVVLLYRRTRKEMPANAMEIDAAEHEGVKMHFLAAPVEVVIENNRVSGIKCVKMELGAPDDSGRRRPVVIPNSEFVVPCDYIFAAIGQSPKLDIFADAKKRTLLPDSGRITLTKWGSVSVKPDTFETDTEAVFAGGDMVTGAATAIEAIAAGRKAAHAIDSYLQTGVPCAEPFYFNSRKDDFKQVELKDLRYNEKLEHRPMPEMDPITRSRCFDEVENGYSPDDASAESKRCLECGCEALFDCKLRQYASEYSVEVKSYKGTANQYTLDQSHPFIELDPNKCILCARCIRLCSEIVGAAVYGFETRGFSTIVRPELGKKLIDTSCISCGLCVGTCPTGAIVAKSSLPKPGPWALTKTTSVCNYCGVGCKLDLNHLGNTMVKVTADEHDSPTRGNLCAFGRFGNGFIQHSNRLKQPRIRIGTDLADSSWANLFAKLAKVIRDDIRKIPGDQIAVFVSPRLTNEEIYVIQKFARVILHTHNVGSATQQQFELIDPSIQSTLTYRGLERSDTILLALADPRNDNTVVDFMIRRAQRSGCKVVYIHSGANLLSNQADKWLNIRQGSDYLALKGVLKALIETGIEASHISDSFRRAIDSISIQTITDGTGLAWEDFIELARILSVSKSPSVVTQRHFPGLRTPGDLQCVQAIATLLKAPLGVLNEHSNEQGLMDLGLISGFLPGYQSVYDQDAVARIEKAWGEPLQDIPAPSSDLITGLIENRFKVVISFGEDLCALKDLNPQMHQALGKLDFLCVADTFMTDTAELADMVIPLCTFAETEGTTTNSMRAIQPVHQAIESMTGYQNWQLITEIAQHLGMRYKFRYASIRDIHVEMQHVIPTHSKVDFTNESGDEIWNYNESPLNHGSQDAEALSMDDRRSSLRSSWMTNTHRMMFRELWMQSGLGTHNPRYFRESE